MNEVIVLTRARFAAIDMERLASVRSRILGVISSVPGFLSTTLWESTTDALEFLAVGHYASDADSILAWDTLTRSPVMEVVGDLLVEPLDSLRFNVRDAGGLSLEKTVPGQFCSLSNRLADIGYGPAVLEELSGIFAELKMIPGFLGYVSGQHTEIDNEIVGLALWDSRTAFEASLPKKALYRMDLFSRVL